MIRGLLFNNDGQINTISIFPDQIILYLNGDPNIGYDRSEYEIGGYHLIVYYLDVIDEERSNNSMSDEMQFELEIDNYIPRRLNPISTYLEFDVYSNVFITCDDGPFYIDDWEKLIRYLR